jgi:hypothetical protein
VGYITWPKGLALKMCYMLLTCESFALSVRFFTNEYLIQSDHPLREILKKLVTKTNKNALEWIVVFFVCLCVYVVSTNRTHSGDTVPNTLFGFNVLENHRIDFDNFRASYLDTPSSYWFIESASGHLSSGYPLGTSIVAFPITVGYWLFLRMAHPEVLITNPTFEPFRIAYEQLAAACITSLSAAIFYFASRIRFNRTTSLTTTFIYAFATSCWAISSQALWQHGAANLCILIATLCITSINSKQQFTRYHPFLLLLTGIACGLLPIVRPVNVIFSISIACYCLLVYKRLALWLLVGCIPLASGLIYNSYYFHNLLGGYQSLFTPEIFRLANFPTGFAGCLFSPGRGLFVYSPVLLFSFIAFMQLFKTSPHWSKNDGFILLLTIVSLTYCTIYFGFKIWWGGACYGPRFMTEAIPMLVFLINYYLEPVSDIATVRRKASLMIFYFLIVVSMLVQMFGVFGTGTALWNAIPLNVDHYPERLWQIHDSPIERSAQSFFRRSVIRGFSKLLGFNSKNEITDSQLRGRVVGLRNPSASIDSTLSVGQSVAQPLKFEVQNLGSLDWLGYESGSDALDTFVYVKVDFLNGNNFTVKNCGGDLPIAGSISCGKSTFAEGEVVFPSAPGRYTMVSHLHCFYVSENLNKTEASLLPVIVRRPPVTRPHF